MTLTRTHVSSWKIIEGRGMVACPICGYRVPNSVQGVAMAREHRCEPLRKAGTQ